MAKSPFDRARFQDNGSRKSDSALPRPACNSGCNTRLRLPHPPSQDCRPSIAFTLSDDDART